jgi:8-oxo-dGTP pyrophosphatase MutT (NUDIX family)
MTGETNPPGSVVPTPRVGARVILLDASDRVLLIHEQFDSYDTRLNHWLTPGGGIEEGEDIRLAAAREVYEETGIEIEIPADSAEVLTTRRLWNWRELWFDQVDHFFLARVADGLEVVPQGLTEVEKQTLLGHRWWSLAELQATDENLLPAELPLVLAEILGA